MSSGSGLTPIGEAFLSASQLREAVEDLSAADINRMSFSDYSKIREAAGLPGIDLYADIYSPDPPGRPRSAQGDPGQVAEVHQDSGVDFSQLSMRQYEAIRSRYFCPSSGTGHGLFD